MGNESSHEIVDDNIEPRTLKTRTLDSVAQYVKDGRAKKVVVLTGAGISTGAGIPDFRSPETGLYANLARLNLPYAEAVFDISYFRNNPEPFYALAKELYPGKYKPTLAHAFVSLLAKKGLLRMLFTQNIDCLERAAGVPSDKIVEAHGSFATQRCIECKTAYPDDDMKRDVMAGEVPHCVTPQCNGLVKPDIVFFGEQLPENFHENRSAVGDADLLLVLGTSLSVQPFASLPLFAGEGVPRVLFNLERVGGLGSRPDDVCVLGDCDAGVCTFADALGWQDELDELWAGVGGGAQDILTTEAVKKDKDEVLEEEIVKLTSEVDKTLKLSNGHREWLEKHLQEKTTKGLSTEVNVSSTTSRTAHEEAEKPEMSEDLSTAVQPSSSNTEDSTHGATQTPSTESETMLLHIDRSLQSTTAP